MPVICRKSEWILSSVTGDCKKSYSAQKQNSRASNMFQAFSLSTLHLLAFPHLFIFRLLHCTFSANSLKCLECKEVGKFPPQGRKFPDHFVNLLYNETVNIRQNETVSIRQNERKVGRAQLFHPEKNQIKFASCPEPGSNRSLGGWQSNALTVTPSRGNTIYQKKILKFIVIAVLLHDFPSFLHNFNKFRANKNSFFRNL